MSIISDLLNLGLAYIMVPVLSIIKKVGWRDKTFSKLPRGKPRHLLKKHFDFETSLGTFKSRLSSKLIMLASHVFFVSCKQNPVETPERRVMAGTC
ncbi:hypothetical protein [Aquimarina sp. RZ0]|uniref:hypothetical protein n=1 Tax=Aquimarina sp. RZ0 TaxID=2607730 RepID=UPI0011F3560F|nr:hypothetical protein [Aquimarina sp. RZ0]KAA1244900.1 hypothetical protein F0000_14250 [Aquimarina sp. RZ0]